MADWKTQVTYNYNPSYRTYAYGLVYQPGSEQNHSNLTGWSENGVTELNNYNTGATQNYYAAATTTTKEESPPGSPEPHAVNGHCYQGSGVVYFGDNQAGRLVLAGPQRGPYEAVGNEVRRTGSDSASDSEAHTSPDSWSSSSSREISLPHADPATWAEKEIDVETIGGSPGGSEDVSSSLMEEPHTFAITGNMDANNPSHLHVSSAAPKKPSTTAVNNPKGKVRAAFSESQMNALVQRFSVQRYLTPAEMKNLAEVTGLTYKQVKTWFQNRRMKLRRHQKDTSWVSERYTINKDSSIQGNMYSNVASHIPPYQGDARHYNQHMMKTPQNLAFYLAAMGSAGTPGYPPWSSGTSQGAVPNRPQVTGWSVPPAGSHFEYNPGAFNSTGSNTVNNFGYNAGFESKDVESVGSPAPLSTAVVHDVRQ
ncbi:homeobox protein NANOG [Leuresthes tenuis]|uniref:homeobox protein NANOG n=1 Tax=Leuresthes tenuis TaxID=355514 RepID=UPI003B50E375